MKDSRFVKGIESLIFDHKPIVIGIFLAITLFLGFTAATQLRIDAGFSKQLPLKHEYMQTFVEYFDEFGGADRVLVALVAKDGDMFDPEFFETLKQATDAVFFVPGVDRPRVTSLFTPNTRYLEVVEDGIQSGPVIPADFQPEQESLERVRKNILKAGLVGRLVANDFSGALISATLLEFNPDTQEKLDYFEVARRFEDDVRGAFETDDISVHIIGFAKVIGDVKDGANRVLLFFLIAIAITTILVYIYSQSWRITFVPVICSLLAVIWQLGLLPLIGIGIDPMGLLVPFLVFAIGVSHGVQMISSVRMEMFDGATPDEAARTSFRRLLLPGGIALISDTIGFITILLIEIQVIQEMAIAASAGVAAIILTNLILLPVLLSYINPADDYEERLKRRAAQLAPVWNTLTKVSERPTALVIILIALGLFGFGWWKGSQVKIGDLQAGVPELRPDSRYNLDSIMITEKFSIGVDLIQVIVQSEPDACIDHEKMAAIDEFARVWAASRLSVPKISMASGGRLLGVISHAWSREEQNIYYIAMRVAKATLEELKNAGDESAYAAFQSELDKAMIRDVVVRATWTGDADVDLIVEEPGGTVCSLHEPQTTGGGICLGDTYADYEQADDTGFTEDYVCPKAFAGSYRVRIRKVWGKLVAGKVTIDVYKNYGTEQELYERQHDPVTEGSDSVVIFELENGRRTEPLEAEQLQVAVKRQNVVNQTVLAQQIDQFSDPSIFPDRNGELELLRRRRGLLGRGAVGFQPVIITLPQGTQMVATAVVSPDRRYVRISAAPSFTGIGNVTTFTFAGVADRTGGGAVAAA